MQIFYSGSTPHAYANFPKNTCLGSAKTNTLDGGCQTTYSRFGNSIKSNLIDFIALLHQYTEMPMFNKNTKF